MAATPTRETRMSVGDMTQKYLQLRRRKRELEDQHKKTLQPFNNLLAQLANLILAELNAAGVDNMKSDEGTVYKSTETSVVVKDWTATLGFIVERQCWDLLEARVGKVAARTMMEETGEPIPGVSMTQEIVLRVRQS